MLATKSPESPIQQEDTRSEASGKGERSTKEGREQHKELPVVLYGNFRWPERGRSVPLGRILDQEVLLSYDRDDKDDEYRYFVGNNDGISTWQRIDQRDADAVFRAFETAAKEYVWNSTIDQDGMSYWYQKHVNGLDPESEVIQERLGGRPPFVESPKE